MMYGVQTLVKNVGYNGAPARWIQVLPPKGKGARGGKSAYTYYAGVAKRWLKYYEDRDLYRQLLKAYEDENLSYSEIVEADDLARRYGVDVTDEMLVVDILLALEGQFT